MICLASHAPNGRYLMPTDHMRCLVAWTGDLGALEAVRKRFRAPNDTTVYSIRTGQDTLEPHIFSQYMYIFLLAAGRESRIRLFGRKTLLP